MTLFLLFFRPAPVSEKAKTGGDKKSRPKDVFGRTLPTEEEFQVLKNAPRYHLILFLFVFFYRYLHSMKFFWLFKCSEIRLHIKNKKGYPLKTLIY